jgi:hypothetical protein
MDNEILEICEPMKKPDIYKYKLDINTNIERAKAVLGIKNNGSIQNIFSVEDLSLIKGERKGRKSFTLSKFFDIVLGNNHDFLKTELQGEKRLAYFDTEQSQYYAQLTNRRISRQSGSDDFDYFYMRGLSKKERKKAIVDYLEWNGKVDFIVIDGIVDLIDDFNAIDESSELVQWLLEIIAKYKVHVCCVLHVNSGTEKARGHLGSMIEQKAETIILVEYLNKMQSKIKFHATRGAGVDDLKLHVNEIGISYIEEFTESEQMEMEPTTFKKTK